MRARFHTGGISSSVRSTAGYPRFKKGSSAGSPRLKKESSTGEISAAPSTDDSYSKEPVLFAIPSYETAKYSIFEIADWFLTKESMTHKKLQKLCYYAQAWFYALKDVRLSDTAFEAWVCGPVSPALHDKFKRFKHSAIKTVGKCLLNISAEDEELLERVWATYGDHTGNALTALSQTEMPWIEARLNYGTNEECTVVISADSMKKYFKSILTEI
jgi:uncharacterized phage-associated protein